MVAGPYTETPLKRRDLDTGNSKVADIRFPSSTNGLLALSPPSQDKLETTRTLIGRFGGKLKIRAAISLYFTPEGVIE
jgi:hypothetical protein